MTDGFDLSGVVPWGRRYFEYEAFFALKDTDCVPGKRILDVGGGPASFAAEAVANGVDVTAIDPLYGEDAQAIRAAFEDARASMMNGLTKAHRRFVWSFYESPAHVERLREEALGLFLKDLKPGKAAGRYVDAALPSLPIENRSFDLALCSHLLFLYQDQLDESFHIAAVKELRSVAHELRIFPLVALNGEPSEFVASVEQTLLEEGAIVERVPVLFEFQKGATEMLRVR